MEKIETLKNLSTDEIYEIILPYVLEVFDDDIELNDKKKTILIFKTIIEMKEKLGLPFFEYLNIFKENLNNLIEEYYNDSKENLDATNDYIEMVKKIPRLKKDEEEKLILQMNNNDLNAKQKLITHNLYLPIYVAKKHQSLGISLDDLIQSRNEALILALDNYDKTKSRNLTGYLFWRILGKIYHVIRHEVIRINIDKSDYDIVIKYLNKYLELKEKLNEEPLVEQISKELNIPYLEVEKIKTLLNKVENIDFLDEEIISEEKSVEDLAINCELTKKLNELFIRSGLTKREIEILSLSFGIGKDSVLDIDIAKQNGVSRQCISLTKASAIYKIRNCESVKNYIVYADKPDQALENIKNLKITRKINP